MPYSVSRASCLRCLRYVCVCGVRCYTYRFLTTGTLEEKIFQRQLSKEGLASVVEGKEQVNSLATSVSPLRLV